MATTREATDVAGMLCSGESAPKLGLASVDVTIPPTHEVGQVERPRRPPPDSGKEFNIIDPIICSTDDSFVSRRRNARPGRLLLDGGEE